MTPTIKTIADFILSQPITETVRLDYFLPLLKNKYESEDEYYFDDLLTDSYSKDYEKLQEKLLSFNGRLNTAKYDIPDIFIEPTELSKNAANNNCQNFENECTELLNNIETDQNKGVLFELIVKYLFSLCNINVGMTKRTGDNGIDLFGTKSLSGIGFGTELTYFIQCKYFSNIKPDINLAKKIASDVLFSLFADSEIKHPVLPIIVCNLSASKNAYDFGALHGIRYFTFKELIIEAAKYTQLNITELKTFLKQQKEYKKLISSESTVNLKIP